MATDIFHIPIMGNVEIANIFCLNWDIRNSFLHECLLSSPLRFITLLFKLLNLIGCQAEKGLIFEKRNVKKSPRNQIG